MDLPAVVSRDEWLAARTELLAEEKAVTRARDALATRRRSLPRPGHCRMIETSANGQPAFACYHADQHGAFTPHALHVLTVTRTGVTRIVAFMDPHTLDHVLRPTGIG